MKLLLVLLCSVMFTLTIAVPLQSNDELDSKEVATEANIQLESDEDASTESSEETSISFCSPVCGEATIDPCGAKGECDEGYECCLDMCLSSTVCRPAPMALSKELQQETSLVPEREDEILYSPINAEEGSELVGRTSAEEEDPSVFKRNAQYDALTYAISPDEYHKLNPLDGTKPQSDFEDSTNESMIATTVTPEDSDLSDLFSSRKKRSPQDESGGFPYIPVHTYDISEAKDKIVEAFENFRNEHFDQSEDSDEPNDEGSNVDEDNGSNFDNDDVADPAMQTNEEVSGETEVDSDLDSDHIEESLETISDSTEMSENGNKTRRKRNSGLEEEEILTDDDKKIETYTIGEEHKAPPTFVFVKKVPGMTLKKIVDSGQATITKIIAPMPVNLGNSSNTESEEETTTLSSKNFETDEVDSEEE